MRDRSPASEDAPYQVMPGLTVEDFEGLKESIRLNGLLVPIEYDEHGAVLDGHHSLRALHELGREQRHSRVIRSGLSEADKVAHALALNVHRRHLTGDQRAEAVHRLRHAGWSIRRIADETGVSKTTVARDLAKPSQVDGDSPETVTGADGKAYRARRSAKPTTVYVHSAHQQKVAEAALEALGGEVPAKAMDLRRLERMRRAKASKERREVLRATPAVAAGPDIRCADIGPHHLVRIVGKSVAALLGRGRQRSGNQGRRRCPHEHDDGPEELAFLGATLRWTYVLRLDL